MAFDPLAPLSDLFGWLTRILYGFFGNYGVAIIMLTIIIRGLLIPLTVKSQKSMLKMQALSGKQAELQRKYGDDKEKYQEALMEMQKENGAGGLSGCLLPVIQIIFIWPIWRIVSGPLIYLSQISIENMESMIALAQKKELIANTVSATNHIGLIQVLNNMNLDIDDYMHSKYEDPFYTHLHLMPQVDGYESLSARAPSRSRDYE